MDILLFLIWISLALQLLVVGYLCALAIYRTSLETCLLKFFVQPFVFMIFLCALWGGVCGHQRTTCTNIRLHGIKLIILEFSPYIRSCLPSSALWIVSYFIYPCSGGVFCSFYEPWSHYVAQACLKLKIPASAPSAGVTGMYPDTQVVGMVPLQCHRIWNSHLILCTHSPC